MHSVSTRHLHVLITGGARGIGAATARLLARGGARVFITDVRQEQGEQLASDIGPNARYHPLDVTREHNWEVAVATAEREFGSLNALFNNAGILHTRGIMECTPDEFRHVLDVNLTGIFLGMQSAAPALKRAGGGVIVNTSSVAGMQGYAGLAAYVASKWGVRGLTKAAALDLAADAIRVVSLHPGPICTPMTEKMPRTVAASQPIARFGEAEEVARMVRFLMSEATYSSGSEFTLDGGALAGQALALES